MRKEIEAVGKTVEIAVQRGARELGVSVDQVTFEVIAEAKKGFLGFGEQPAKVKVIYELFPIDIGYDFVKTLVDDMGICAECHPFITGKQKLVDVAGRVEKFRRRYEKNAAK